MVQPPIKRVMNSSITYAKPIVPNSKSSIDTGWGLIYRLNTLFNKIEDSVLAGDLEKWNFILDRIYVNLCYKDPMLISYQRDEDTGDIVAVNSIELPIGDRLVHQKFRDMIREVKKKMYRAAMKRDRYAVEMNKEKHYEIMCMKDMWLRKVMMDKGLYLKESDFDPARSMWGG